jgi:2-dehydropantoate 2-reductase
MRYLCFGVGAIGTYIGGSLVLGGDEVIFLERPEYVNGLRRNGISLDLNGGKHHLKDIIVTGTLDEALMAGPFDVAIFAIKSFDTQKAIEEIKPYHVALPPFLCLQNGVENENFLSSALGEAKVIHGTVTSAIGRNGAGDIVLERLRGVGISARHGLSEKILSSFNNAGLRAKLYDQPVAMKWSKMLTNLLIKEALQVMRAQNIPVVELPGTPVNWLVRAIDYLPLQISQPLLKKTLGSGRGGKMPSFHIDLYTGRKKSEVTYLNGAIVRAGERLGFRAPVNRILTETLIRLADGRLNKEDFAGRPQILLQLIQDEERKSI